MMNRLVTSSRWQVLILTVWVLLAIAAFPFASRVNQELDASARLKGSESAAGELLIDWAIGCAAKTIPHMRRNARPPVGRRTVQCHP
jgi:hypothetical protein